jgi:hypothetical protein
LNVNFFKSYFANFIGLFEDFLIHLLSSYFDLGGPSYFVVAITNPAVAITNHVVVITNLVVVITNPVVVITNPVVVITNPVVVITNPMVVITNLVVVITNPVVVITNPEVITAYFVADPTYFMTDPTYQKVILPLIYPFKIITMQQASNYLWPFFSSEQTAKQVTHSHTSSYR